MAQTAAIKRAVGDVVDYTPTSAKTAGDVVEFAPGLIGVCSGDIAANTAGTLDVEGVFDLPKSSDVFTVGKPVFWDGGGTPVTGTAASGAATNAVGTFAGIAVAAAANTASYVRTRLNKQPADLVETHLADAAGGNIATATQLEYGTTVVANADNSKGVILPSCVPGMKCVVVNQNTDKTLKIYPPVGKQINGAGANNAVVAAVNTIDTFISEGYNSWVGTTAAIDLA
jgi:predicted RecA/RadA family phage recombinase